MGVHVIPYVAASPIGLAVLGVAGFLSYKAGRRAGLKSGDDLDQPGMGDKAVKGAMKMFYRTKKSVSKTLSRTGEKYTSMWHDAQEEVNTTN